uniref:Uncharacterized protein AlNc14C161G7784 n=1 Tax=Albugo laibachii Nc14 TaxID=890382 RepID=F0WMU8_9STRA|nr:conserved hypothetical protein [Albugo laibachii Nc14]|eukprot:CCA22633.1 conserved hypothetical protein [Albugo laibachii Nc14]
MPSKKPTAKEPLTCGPSSPSHQSDFSFLDCCRGEASLPLARPPRSCTSYEKLPLPEDYFSNVTLTQEHEQVYRNEIARTVDQLFEVERRFLKQGSRNHKEWKHINRKFDFDYYHKIPKSREVPTPPVVISIGTIPGTIEDLLFGDYTPDQQSYKQRTAYVDAASIRDAHMISNFPVPQGTPYTNKNFSYLSLKWCITRIPLPGADLFIKPRDWFYYEALGLTAPRREDVTNADPVGYLIMRPCELANVRPFSSSVLGRYACVSLYRQIAPDCVQVFTEVDVDLAGEMVGSSLAVHLGVTMSSRSFEIVRYVESMKLAELNRIQSQVLGEKDLGRTDHCLNCRRDVRTFMGRFSTTIRKCSICGSPICSRCRIKKRMAGKNLKRKLWCCQRCILTTRTNIFRSTELVSDAETPNGLHSSSDTDDVVDANSLDIFEICDKDALDSLDKVSLKAESCVDLATLSIEPEQFSTSSPSSTKYDKSILPTSITEAQIDLDSRTSTSHASGSIDEVNSLDSSSNWRNSTVSSPSTVGLSGYQISMYQQMIALRKAAETAYELTQANRKAMRN